MGALSHFIEREGVATVGISLIREHTETVKPPRALWVPFPLGRPYGVPGDADFQRDVLRAALDLLPTATEHTIVGYPKDAPAESFSDDWSFNEAACPVSFAATDADTLGGRLRAEVQRLTPWWLETYRARGRSLVGTSGGGPEDVGAMAALLAAVVDGVPLDALPEASERVDWTHPMPLLVRHVTEDLRFYYQEAAAAQPSPEHAEGVAPSHRALNNWIYRETVLGETILAVGRRLTESDVPGTLFMRGLMIPEGYWAEGATWGTEPGQRGRLKNSAMGLNALARTDYAGAQTVVSD